jgi:C1A family cysteine protease
MPSRLFIYYNERVIENTVNNDNGAMIRDGIKTVNKLGVCPEDMWPYNPSEFTQKPQSGCYKEALKHQALSYHRVVRDINQLKGCLSQGYPFIFGFSVYEGFEGTKVAQTGVLDMPAKKESLIGGHAVTAVGYDDPEKRFIVRNSWGTGWGQKGYFTMPYEYLLHEQLSNDFWMILLVEENPVSKK